MTPRPRITALGGGTGLSTVLRGLKSQPVDLTAIVSVADNGGSSGRLRRELGMLPPGDIRSCLVALADEDSLIGRLFQHRFRDGDLAGHSFGNLFLAAAAEVTGSFDEAIAECATLLGITGRVLPSTLTQVQLWAERADGSKVWGETQIGSGSGACRRVWLEPRPIAHEPAVEAILDADVVLLGPGSLFTSVLPHLAIPEIAVALQRSRGLRVYVGNVMTQPGETRGFDAADHLERILDVAPGGIDVAVVHDGPLDPAALVRYRAHSQELVATAADRIERRGVRVVARHLAASGEVVRHSARVLAGVVMELARSGAGAPDSGTPIARHLQRTSQSA